MTVRRSLSLLVALGLAGSTTGCNGCKALFQKHDVVDADAGAETLPVAAAEDSIPTPQDFEEEALQKVTPANFRAELLQLRKDIAAK